MNVWVQGSGGINADGSRVYSSEKAMRAGACALLRKRAKGPFSEVHVFAKWGPYSGPEQDSYIGKAAFQGDGATAAWFPAGTQ